MFKGIVFLVVGLDSKIYKTNIYDLGEVSFQ